MAHGWRSFNHHHVKESTLTDFAELAGLLGSISIRGHMIPDHLYLSLLEATREFGMIGRVFPDTFPTVFLRCYDFNIGSS